LRGGTEENRETSQSGQLVCGQHLRPGPPKHEAGALITGPQRFQ